MENQPIGIFDSGIGGLTVVSSIAQKLPQENIIYFGDTANTPWGDKSATTIQHYCHHICDFLIQHNCKLIVIACNTASAIAYQYLSKHFKGKVILNVIDPVINYLHENFANKKIGLIGTKQTIQSGCYQRSLAHNIRVTSLATPLLVPIIEEGFAEHKLCELTLHEYLANEKFNDIDALILGCTHYPLLSKMINDFFNHKVTLINSANIIAQATKQLITPNSNRKPVYKFYVSDLTSHFTVIANRFFPNCHLEVVPLWQ